MDSGCGMLDGHWLYLAAYFFRNLYHKKYEKPAEQEIADCLKIDIGRLKKLYETAGNFLIEIPMVSPENQKKETNGEKPSKEQESRVETLENV